MIIQLSLSMLTVHLGQLGVKLRCSAQDLQRFHADEDFSTLSLRDLILETLFVVDEADLRSASSSATRQYSPGRSIDLKSAQHE